MRLTLRQLQIFTAVAETGSTTAAGLRVSLSQSATSGALIELEGVLGTELFDRIGKRLVLNDSGLALLPQARSMLHAARDIETQFDPNAGDSGAAVRLRVGASTTIGNYILPGLIAQHLQASPDSAIDVFIDNTQEVAASVARLEVDMGLIEGPCHERELSVVPWLEDELVIVCAPDNALALGKGEPRVPVKALQEARWLQREPGSGTRETVDYLLLPHLLSLRADMQIGSTEAIKQAVAQGLGLACLSLCAVEDLVTLGRLVVLNTTLPRLTRRLYLIHHRQKCFSHSLRRFVERCQSPSSLIRTP